MMRLHGRKSPSSEAAAETAASKGVTRRRFLAGGALAGAAAMATISLAGCSGTDDKKETTGEPQVITDDSKIINVTEDYKVVDVDLKAAQSWNLPLGTLLFNTDGDWVSAMMAPESARSVNTLGVLSLSSGSLTTLVETPTQGSGYGFHDVRCGTDVLAWVEEDYSTGDWVLVAQSLSAGALQGDPVKLDAGNADWEPARIAATGSTVIWQKMPLASGSKRSSASHCYRWTAGDKEGAELCESPGRFATTPRISDGILCIVPRVDADKGTYYGLTAIDLGNGQTVDRLVFPENVRPFEAVYMGESFAFSVEADYGYGGSLGSMGSFIGREGGPYVYLAREPLSCICGKGTRYLIKVRSSHVLVDTEAKTYGTLTAPSGCLDFGDYSASEGTTGSFLTYATLRSDETGLPESVSARLFSL